MNYYEKIENKYNGKIKVLSKYISIKKTPRLNFKCEIHGEFEANSQYMTRSKGDCPFCKGSLINNITINEFLLKKFNNKISFKDEWIVGETTVFDKLKFNCSEHGDFYINYSGIRDMNEDGCPECGYTKARDKIKNKTIERLNNILINSHIKLVESSYTDVNTPAKFICKEHGIFYRRPGKILYSNRFTCPKCSQSNGEKIISDILEKNNIEYYSEIKLIPNKLLRYDFFIPKFNVAIEVDGKQHYDKNSYYYSEETIKNDQIKNKFCIDNNIFLIRIYGITDTTNLSNLENKLIEIIYKERSTTIDDIYFISDLH